MSKEFGEYDPADIAAFDAACEDERLSGGERPNWAVRLSPAMTQQFVLELDEWLKTHPSVQEVRVDFTTNDFGTVIAWEISVLK